MFGSLFVKNRPRYLLTYTPTASSAQAWPRFAPGPV